MTRNKNMMLTILVVGLVVGLLGWSESANAQNAIRVGGRTSIAVNFAFIASNPDEGKSSDTVVLGGVGAYTTESGRFEYGLGFSALVFSSDVDLEIYQISGQARVNSDLLGPEENVLIYAGGIAGASFIEILGESDELGVFGPKIGVEFYITPNTAIQIEDNFLVDTDSGFTNTLKFGFKLLFQ